MLNIGTMNDLQSKNRLTPALVDIVYSGHHCIGYNVMLNNAMNVKV